VTACEFVTNRNGTKLCDFDVHALDDAGFKLIASFA
jgi:hypothetical protein